MRERLSTLIQRKAVLAICRVVLAAVFIFAALGKIANPQEFADAVAAFKLLPISWVNVFAIILPWVELTVGLTLLLGSQLRQAAILAILMNTVFIVAASSAMARGLDIQCGCFTISKAHSSVGWGLVARDLGFALLAVPVMLFGAAEKKNEQARADAPASA
jgi:uncharacterized membrane protein YphA (DoxX/SURF4 family)